jgi:predicted glycoside hydrolase/deacetylase ChbG (UPF0249 family)
VIPLCITADDYGLSRDVNAAIHSLVGHGAVSAVSVMVHREAQLDDVAALRGRVATGLHLMLVGERPLCAALAAPLLDAQGFLPMRYWGLMLKGLRHRGWLDALTAEIAAQVARYRTLGLPLHFVNSHQHVHLLVPIWDRIRRVLAAHGAAPAMRTAERALRGGVQPLLLGASSRLAGALRPMPGRVALQAIGLGFAGRSSLDDLERALQRVARAPRRTPLVHELVMHPGLEHGPPAARHGAWGIRWRREHDVLLSPEFHALLRRHAVDVLSPARVAERLGGVCRPPS